MKKLPLLLLGLALVTCAPRTPEMARWEGHARNVTIVRDHWGIPHIHGSTDADAVFGLMYTQAEDDFNRIEVNFLNSQGRLAEAEGEGEIWRDLRMRLFIDPEEMKALYEEAPEWLRALMDAWADGLNYYLYTHPQVKPRVLTHFEPWMALTFSEGSIGGDIERVNLRALEAFYGSRGLEPATSAGGGERSATTWTDGAPTGDTSDDEPRGSNGIAIAPQNTVEGHALLLINPHTSFFFRHEARVSSDEGLNAYGALTWGQFFIYQGFNDRLGWMHTSSSVDNIDEWLEAVVENADGTYSYRYGSELRPLSERKVRIAYKAEGGMGERTFTVYRSHRGPIVREQDGRWVSVGLKEDPLASLIQSYSRTKARNLDEYLAVMALHANSSNNTLYADADGNIAYFHANFVPVRDTSFDFSRPVDGMNPATDWKGVHTFDQSPNVINPPNGWVFCTNNWPYSAAGPYSPKASDFPSYMDRGSENPRGINAIRVLEGRTDFTLERLRDAAYDSFLPAFAEMVPALLAAYDSLDAGDPRRSALGEQADTLRTWDYRWGAESVATSLAVFWGEEVLGRVAADARRAGTNPYEYVARYALPEDLLEALRAASDRLVSDFGDWRTPWGEINRFQRLTGDLVQPFSDERPSTPVPFTSARWGSLASFGARAYPGTKRWYGTSGNSFVAVVEFGERVRALAVTAGGVSSDPSSPHFNDQEERYALGELREVYFHPDQLEGRTVRRYRPGRR